MDGNRFKGMELEDIAEEIKAVGVMIGSLTVGWNHEGYPSGGYGSMIGSMIEDRLSLLADAIKDNAEVSN